MSEDPKIIDPNREPESMLHKVRSHDRVLYIAFAVYLLLALAIMASCNSYALIGVAKYFGTYIPACMVFFLVVSQFSVLPRCSRRALCLVVGGVLLSALVGLAIAATATHAVSVTTPIQMPVA